MIWHHVCILARDLERTLKFYQELLQAEEVEQGWHPDDPGTPQLVMRDQGGIYWVFHFYPKSHRAQPGEGSVVSLQVGQPGDQGKCVKDPDGLSLNLVPATKSSLLGVSLCSGAEEFWSRWWPGREGLKLLNPDGQPPAALGYGTVHHLALKTGLIPESGSPPVQGPWGTSRYLYSPCGMLVELWYSA